MAAPRLENKPCGGRYGDIVQSIGNTPLIELRRLSPKPSGPILAKLRSRNPTRPGRRHVTPERTQLLEMFGAEIVYSEGAKGSNGAVELALEMAEADSSYYMPYQYGNEANPRAHYNGTALEILEELDDIAAFVAGLGTGGSRQSDRRAPAEHSV